VCECFWSIRWADRSIPSDVRLCVRWPCVDRAASENAPTSTEILQLASEQDGTRDGRDKEEQKRRKEEDWAVYTELNKKGAGNTMNRG